MAYCSWREIAPTRDELSRQMKSVGRLDTVKGAIDASGMDGTEDGVGIMWLLQLEFVFFGH